MLICCSTNKININNDKIKTKPVYITTYMKGLLFWFFNKMKDLPKGQSESVYRRRTDTTMAKRIKRIDEKTVQNN